MSEEQWSTLIDVNLSGVWRTMKAAVPHMIEARNGGSIVIMSSIAGKKALPGQAHYAAAKHGLVGLTQAAAVELGEYKIRVNSVHPYGVNTPMGTDPNAMEVLRTHPRYIASFGSILTDTPLAEPDDVTNAVLFLAGDSGRTITGTHLSVDMGASAV